jgi:AraC family transcriptional regulator
MQVSSCGTGTQVEKAIELAVGRVIEAMRENLGEQLTVDDMARTAMFSKFHFSRVFQRVTGVSPGRFLSAVRLQEAKHLLVTTGLTVTEISHRVGYTSVGTFSSRFRRSVGVSPTTYRQLGGFTARPAPQRHRNSPPPRSATVRGEVRSTLDRDQLGLVFVGLFADRVPQGQPVRCTVLHRLGSYQLEDVPDGTWYLLAHSVAADFEEAVRGRLAGGDGMRDGQVLCLGASGPLDIRPDTTALGADVDLRPVHDLDPPLLRALLDVRSVTLTVSAA